MLLIDLTKDQVTISPVEIAAMKILSVSCNSASSFNIIRQVDSTVTIDCETKMDVTLATEVNRDVLAA